MSASQTRTPPIDHPYVATPHDHLLKRLLDDPGNLEVILEEFLPKDMYESLDTSSLESSKETFIDEFLKKYIADRVFRCRTKDGRSGSIYILIEHKYQSEAACAVQMLKYMVHIWLEELENGRFAKRGKLSFVLPILFYQGKEKWRGRQMRDLFEKDSPYSVCVPDFRMIVGNLGEKPQQEMLERMDKTFLLLLLQALLLDDPESQVQKILVLALKDKNLTRKILIHQGKQLRLFLAYTTVTHPKIAKNIKKHMENFAMQADFLDDTDNPEFMEYWFPKATEAMKVKFFNTAFSAGREEGRAKSKAESNQATRQSIALIVQRKFGDVEEKLLADLDSIDDREQLTDLTVVAGTAVSLEEVRTALRRYLDKNG